MGIFADVFSTSSFSPERAYRHFQARLKGFSGVQFHRKTGEEVAISRASFADIIDRIESIPTLPEVVTEICRLVNDPFSDASDIHDIVKKDAAMAAKMLRMVNSVYYGMSEPVRDLEQALVILGIKTIRSIALSVSVINMFQQSNSGFNMKSFWTHSAVSAGICRLVAGRGKFCDPELAFIIGLLKDIGKLVLVENAPEETRSIIAVAREFQLPFHKAAHEVLATDDAEISAWLCERWGLDEILVETIAHQNLIDQAADARLVAMCQFNEYLCGVKKIRVSGSCDQPTLNPTVWRHLGMSRATLVEVMSEVNDEVDNARNLLHIVQ
jgi:HD-like signal output (HDOD) protein